MCVCAHCATVHSPTFGRRTETDGPSIYTKSTAYHALSNDRYRLPTAHTGCPAVAFTFAFMPHITACNRARRAHKQTQIDRHTQIFAVFAFTFTCSLSAWRRRRLPCVHHCACPCVDVALARSLGPVYIRQRLLLLQHLELDRPCAVSAINSNFSSPQLISCLPFFNQ